MAYDEDNSFNSQISNFAFMAQNKVLELRQSAEALRGYAARAKQIGDNYTDRTATADAYQAELEAKTWAERERVAREGYLLHDASSPQWCLNYQGIISAAGSAGAFGTHANPVPIAKISRRTSRIRNRLAAVGYETNRPRG